MKKKQLSLNGKKWRVTSNGSYRAIYIDYSIGRVGISVGWSELELWLMRFMIKIFLVTFDVLKKF